MQKLLFNLSLFLVTAFTLSSCAHHRDVRPGGFGGEHSVIIKSKSQEEGVRDAIAQATSYCKQFDKVPKITSEGKKYQGDIDEEIYKQSRKIKEAASVFLGDAPEAGKINKAADKYLGDPYSTEVKFKCR